MMYSKLLPHQNDLLNSINIHFRNTKFVIIKGASGCGKSYALEYLHRNYTDYGFELSVFLDGNYFSEDRDYSPFKKALFSGSNMNTQYIKKGVVEVVKDVPFVGNTLSYITDSLVSASEAPTTNIFNIDEQIIINQIMKLTSGKKCNIICDNIHWWDNRSIKLLLMFLHTNFAFAGKDHRQINFVLSVTPDQITQNSEILQKLLRSTNPTSIINFPSLSYNDFRKQLYIKTSHKLSEAQIDLLYNLTNGHLQVFYDIIDEIKNKSFDFDLRYDSNIAYLSQMLDKRLKECGATGSQIVQVLEYASIIGMSFSALEIEKATDYSKIRLRKIIMDSSSLKLTEHTTQSEYYKFAHDIIREIFMTKVDVEHYEKMSMCLKEIKPGQYLRRAKYMMQSLCADKAAILYCLEMVAQLRNYCSIPNNLKQDTEHILTSQQKEYISYMELAYSAHYVHDFDTALTCLNLILDYYPPVLQAERDILKLRCLSKRLATEEIAAKTEMLAEICMNDGFDGEKEVEERFAHALITAFVHLGEFGKAKEIEKKILTSLSDRLNFDELAESRVHLIQRNANAIHDIETSPTHIKRAVSFFGQKDANNAFRDIRQYYTSLINYSAVLTMQGDFSDAYNQTLTAFEIEKNNGITFPRPQILRNNFILASVLINRIKASDAINMYDEILSGLHGVMAEKLFYTSNMSIMYALDNRPEKAYDFLYAESQNHNIGKDMQGSYRYHVVTNCAIYKHLMGDTTSAIMCLEEQYDSLASMVNSAYFMEKNKVLIEVMRETHKISGADWIFALHQRCPNFRGIPWRYFGLGYAFIALCDWGV